MRRRRAFVAAVAGISMLVAGCGGGDSEGGGSADTAAAEGKQQDVLVQFTYKVRGEYAHLFVADEKGYFAEEGLNVTFREGQGAEPVLASLSSQDGNTFVVAAMNQAAAAITKDLPLKSVATWEPAVPSVLVAMPDSQLTDPKSLEGMTVGLKQGQNAALTFEDFLVANGVDKDKVEIRMLDSAAANAVFLKGDVDAVDAFLTNEVPTLQAEVDDGELKTLRFGDYGFPDLGIGVVVKDGLIDANPELIRAFLRASARGIQAMKDDPEGAAKIIKSRYSAVLPDESVVLAQVNATIDEMPKDGDHEYGWIDPSTWEAAIETAKSSGVIPDPLPADEYFTNEFLK